MGEGRDEEEKEKEKEERRKGWSAKIFHARLTEVLLEGVQSWQRCLDATEDGGVGEGSRA